MFAFYVIHIYIFLYVHLNESSSDDNFAALNLCI